MERPVTAAAKRATPEAVLADPQFGGMVKLWSGTLKEAPPIGVPLKRMIDPTAVPRGTLPYLMMIDIIEGAARLRYRLVGTAYSGLDDAYLMGRYFDESFSSPAWLDYITGLYQLMIEFRRPVYTENHTPLSYQGRGLPRHMSRLMLPYTVNGKAVDLCLALQVFDAPPPHEAPPSFFSAADPEILGELCRIVL